MMKSFRGFASRSTWTHHPETHHPRFSTLQTWERPCLSLSTWWRGGSGSGFWLQQPALDLPTWISWKRIHLLRIHLFHRIFFAFTFEACETFFFASCGWAWKLTTPAVENKPVVVETFNEKCIWNRWNQRKVQLKSLKINRYLVAFDAFGTTSGKTISFLLPFLGFFFISPGSTESANFLSFRFDLFLELTASSWWLVTILTLGFFTFFTSIGSSRSSIGSSRSSIGSSRSSIGSSNLFTFFGFVLDFLSSVFSSTFSDAFFWTESAWHVFFKFTGDRMQNMPKNMAVSDTEIHRIRSCFLISRVLQLLQCYHFHPWNITATATTILADTAQGSIRWCGWKFSKQTLSFLKQHEAHNYLQRNRIYWRKLEKNPRKLTSGPKFSTIFPQKRGIFPTELGDIVSVLWHHPSTARHWKCLTKIRGKHWSQSSKTKSNW